MSQLESKVVELDVREDLKNKIEPFQKIMEAVKPLNDGDIFILHAPFKPTPLLPIFKAKGFSNTLEQIDNTHWKITFTKRGGK